MHFGNYVSARDAKRIVEEGIGEITMSRTALKQTPKETISFLKENGVSIRELRRCGRPKVLDEDQIDRILTMKKEGGLSFKKIENLTGVAKSTVFDYYKRYNGKKLGKEKIFRIEREVAHSTFRTLLREDLCDEVNELAKRGLLSRDIGEMEALIREIGDIIY